MGFSPCLPCKKDLGEAPSLRSVPRPGGSPHAVWWHKQVQMLQLAIGMEVLQDAQGEAASKAKLPRLGGGQQGTNMNMPHIYIYY